MAWPGYELCLKEGKSSSGGIQRSKADVTFCCIAIDLFKRTPEETAARLMEVSEKAKQNGHDYALAKPCAPPNKSPPIPAAGAGREGERTLMKRAL